MAKGIQLPQELEIAANISPLIGSKLRDKDVKRRAIVNCCRFQKPNDILENVFKKIKTLKKHKYNFKYLHDSENRNRDLIRELMREFPNPRACIPSIFKQQKHITRVGYSQLKLSLEAIVELLLFDNPEMLEEAIISHPLVNCYFVDGQLIHNGIIKSYLRNTVEIQSFGASFLNSFNAPKHASN